MEKAGQGHPVTVPSLHRLQRAADTVLGHGVELAEVPSGPGNHRQSMSDIVDINLILLGIEHIKMFLCISRNIISHRLPLTKK